MPLRINLSENREQPARDGGMNKKAKLVSAAMRARGLLAS